MSTSCFEAFSEFPTCEKDIEIEKEPEGSVQSLFVAWKRSVEEGDA